MPVDSLLTLLGIILAAAWTPGPNNMMLAASGVNFGMRATIPHITGVFVGFGFMIFSVGLGLGEIFDRLPILHIILKWAGAALLLWVAWQIANAKAPGEPGARTKPFTFIQAAAFQWINPKAWVMCISIVGQFLDPSQPYKTATIIAGVAMIGGITSATGWASFGAFLQRWLKSPRHLHMFNYTMAGIIVLGVITVLLSGIGG